MVRQRAQPRIGARPRRSLRAEAIALGYGTSTLVLGMVATLAGAGAAHAQAVNLGGAVNSIIPDGLTRTHVTVTGNRTAITTGTVSKGTGFNSFSDFREAAGQRVDLFLPDGTGNLVNIVRNGSVVVDGVLNAYKSGEIGGNVYFSDPHGFIVGQSGTVNVGALTVNTPTTKFLDGVVGAGGKVDDQAAGQLMRGEIPISPDGIISISGVINAKDGVTLQGQTVFINGKSGPITGDGLDQRTRFESTVNTTGLVEGGALVAHGGIIAIVAAGDVHLGGRVDVSAAQPGAGGRISVRSGGNIALEGSAGLAAAGYGATGAGGGIEIRAGGTLLASDGAVLNAHGAGTGQGGFVDLSGQVARIGAIAVDLASDHGKAGTLLFDPYDLVIGGTTTDSGSSNDYSLAGSITSQGANVVLEADHSITLASGGLIDTRQISGGTSTGDSGSITLVAPSITLDDGSRLLAGVSAGSTYAAGDIELDATQADGGTARIVIGQGTGAAPVLTGRNITLKADSAVDEASLLVATPTAHADVAITSADIAATGLLRATATADAAGGASLLPVGVVVTDVESSVEVGGASIIHATSAQFKAASTVDSRIATQSLAPPSSAADGAVAVSTITSAAESRVGGTTQLTVDGALEVTADNAVTSEASATPQAAAFGASVAVSVIHATTNAEIADQALVNAGSLDLAATTTTAVTLEAAAAAGGATQPETGSEADSYLNDPAYSPFESTGEGQVSVVGGLAISDMTSTTTAKMGSSRKATITGALTVHSATANTADVTADGSAVDSTVGVGVALALNLAKVTNDATIAQAVDAGSVDLSALMAAPDGVNGFTTIAVSGAGGENVGVAGSLAVNLVDTESVAAIAAGTSVTAHGAVSISSEDNSESKASATPDETGASGGKVGVGASVALNIVANRSSAEVGDAASLSGVGDLSLSALASHTIETEAEAGSSGGIAITPALGLSLVNNTTTAQLGTGATQDAAGKVEIAAIQQASETTSAAGQAKGGKAAVGAALALALVNDQSSATTLRAIDAGGDVTVSAMGASLSTLTADASATGAEAADDSGAAPPGQAPDVDTTVTGAFTSAGDKQDKAGVGDSAQQADTQDGVQNGDGRSASSSEGKVTVAAAVGINVQTSKVTATIPDGVDISAGGALTLLAVNNTDGSVTADGSAVGTDGAPSAQVGIGAAVAVNSVHTTNDATLGVGTHSAASVSISALKLEIAALLADPTSTATRADTYLASATSGAGGSKVGVAGSLGLNLVDTESVATISANSVLSVTGAVALASDNETNSTARALPDEAGAAGGKFGIGASVALNIVANRSTAEIGNNVALAGVEDLSIKATAAHEIETEAEAGASGGIGITPVLGLSLVNNTTTAQIGVGALLSTTQGVEVEAEQDSSVTTSASAKAAGGKAAIGAALALALVDDSVTATTNRAIKAGGDVTFSASGTSAGTLTSQASATGSQAADDKGEAQPGDKSVDDKVDGELSFGSQKQTDAGVGDNGQQSDTRSTEGTDHSAKTSEGKVSVAAAVSVNVTKSSVTASLPDAIDITSGGRLTVESFNHTDGSASADASATDSQIGIGAAVAVNAVHEVNTASLGVATYSAQGVTVQALEGSDPHNLPTDTFSAKAMSGAGGSKVGVAGSLALNLVTVDTNAEIKGGAQVDAGSGTSVIAAGEQMSAAASARPSDDGVKGGKVGIGASVALNLITTTTTAQLDDGAVFLDGAGLEVGAASVISTETEAEAGAAGGVAVDAVVALADLNETTTARIGTGAALDMGGEVAIEASNEGENTATATGEAKAGSVGVGAAAAVIVGGGAKTGDLSNTSITSATLARDVTADALSIVAESSRTYEADATATAGGGKFNESDPTKNETTGGTAESTKTVDQTKNYQKGTKNGEKVDVAAAVGVAAAQDVVSATLAGVTVDIANGITVSATSATDVAAFGSGKSVSRTSQVGVGIGLGLGIMTGATNAAIADGSHVVHASSIDVTATSSENTDPAFLDKLTAEAISGASSMDVSVAGSLAVGISIASTTASIGDNVTVDAGGAINVATDTTSKLSAKSWADSNSTGDVGVGASIAVVYGENTSAATIGSADEITADSVSVTATSHKVDDPTHFTFSSLDDLKDQVESKALLGASNYYAEAIGGAASDGVAVQGSFAVMVFDDSVTASVGQSLANPTSTTRTSIDSTGAVAIAAQSDFSAKALSGGIALGGNVGVGLSSSDIVGEGTTRAFLADNAEILNSASFSDTATAAQDMEAFGVTAAAGDDAGVAGVATVITSSNDVEALLGLDSSVATAGNVRLAATNGFTSFSLAGGAAGGGQVGLGAAASVIEVDNITRAALADAVDPSDAVKIDAAGTVDVAASATESGLTLAAAGAGSDQVAVGAGLASYILSTTTEALVGTNDVIGQGAAPAALSVSAADTTTLDTISGAIAGGGTAGAGAGAAVGALGKTTRAVIGAGASVRAGDVAVTADNAETASVLSVGVGIGGEAGLAGAISVYSITDTTTALVDSGATVLADDNVAVLAGDDGSIDYIAGGAAIGGTAAVGASAGVAVVDTTTHARIADGASVTALGNGTAADYITGYAPSLSAFGTSTDTTVKAPSTGSLSAQSGPDGEVLNASDAEYEGLRLLALERHSTPITASGHGVVVNASGRTAMRAMVAGAAVSGTASVGLSADVPVITSDTEATIGDGARINLDNDVGANALQSVAVAAAGDFYHIGVAGSVSASGTVGVGGGAEIAVVSPTTRATIGGGTLVAAERDVTLGANGTEDFVGAAASGAVGGVVSLAGGLSTFALTTHTEAAIGQGSTVDAGGNVAVLASDITRTATLAGSVSVGLGGAGIGGSIGLTLVTKDTEASIADGAIVNALGNSADLAEFAGSDFSTTRAGRGVLVEANSNESLFTLGIAGAGGFYGGVAGDLTIELVDTTTLAWIGTGASINATNAGANSAQDVTVTARDSTSLAANDGAVSGSAGAAVSGAVDAGILRNTTAAIVGDGADINAARNVEVAGLQNTSLDSTVISASGALAGIAAGISVYSIGDGLDPSGQAAGQLDSPNGSVGHYAQNQLGDNTLDTKVLSKSTDGHVRDVSASAQSTRSALDVDSALTRQAAFPAGTSASIGKANVTAGGAVGVETNARIDTAFAAGAVAGGAVGLGAGIGVVVVDTSNTAQVNGASADTIRAASLIVGATTTHTLAGAGLAGTAAAGLSSQAAVATFVDTSRTSALLVDDAVEVSGRVAVNASDDTLLAATAGAVGISFSGPSASAGAGVGVLDKTTTAMVAGAADITAGDVSVDAESAEQATTITAGLGAGGIAGAAGAISVLSVSDTTTAEIGSGATVLAQNNAAVLANDATGIDSLIGGGAAGGAAGIGASIGVAVIDATTHATIDAGADVTALGLGGALDYVVGYDGDFTAYTDDFKAPAIDQGKVGSSGGSASAPLTADDAKAAGLDLLTEERVATALTKSGKGVIVNATDTNRLRSVTLGGGLGGVVGASLSANVPVITADTEATIGANARINQGAGTAGTGQSVLVAAASDVYDLGVAGSVAGGGLGAGGAGTALAIVDTTTKALVGAGSALSAKGDIGVTARAREDFAEASAAGSAGGLASLAGGLSTIAVTDVTTAELAGTAIAQGNVDVLADDQTRAALLAGAVSASGGLGLGASIGVLALDKTTTADIADNAQVTALGGSGGRSVYDGSGFSGTETASGISVLANSAESDFTVAVAGGIGLDAGVSGVVSLELSNVTTTAYIGADTAINGAGGNAGAASDQDVAVAARDSTTTLTLDGGFAAGLGAGLNGTIDVGVFRNTTDAYIADGSTIAARRNVLVNALANKAGDSTTVSGAIGAVALAAGISIYDYGNGIDPGGAAAGHIRSASGGAAGLGDILSMVGGQTGNATATGMLATSDDSDVRTANQTAQANRAGIDVSGAATLLNLPAGTSASIGDATITAGGTVGVNGRDQADVHLTTGAISAGLVGLGAGIGVATIETGNTAQVVGASTITAAAVTVAATTTHTLSAASRAGTGGLAAAAEADVAVLADNSDSVAFIAGDTLMVSGAVNVEAATTRSATASAKGAAVAGGAAIGISLADASIGGEVEAYLGTSGGQGVTIGSAGSRASDVTISATSTDSASADAVADAGGIGVAGEGASASASSAPLVSAYLDGAAVFTTGLVTLRGDAEDTAGASADGLAISALISSGGSVASARLAAAVTTDIRNGTMLDVGSLAADAWVSHMATAPVVNATASGSSGAFVGINATDAEATNASSAQSAITGSGITATGRVEIAAVNTTNQAASASGNAGGIVAVGANIAHANSNTQTLATLTDLVGLTAGDIRVTATGSDTNQASATSGSGGVVAGAAAEADTSATSVTRATAETSGAANKYTLSAIDGTIELAATHASTFGGSVDSTQAAVVGASGASLNHKVDSTVDAHLGDYAVVRAADLAITAHNLTHNFFLGEPGFGLYPGATPNSGFDGDAAGWNVDSGSGGLVNLPAGSVSVTIAHVTNASIGSHADVHLLAPTSGLSLLTLEAYNEIVAHEKAKLDSGGAIATAAANVDIEVPTDTANVSIGTLGTVLVDLGDIEAAAWGNTDLDGRAAATTYGLAGAPSGKAWANLTAANTLDLGQNLRLEVADGLDPIDGSTPTHGTIMLAAGDSLAGAPSETNLHTTVDLYNKTAIPIDTTPDAQSNVAITSSVTIADDSGTYGGSATYGVNAAGDITIRADRGQISTTAVGTGKDIYLEALSKAASAISSVFGGGDVTFDHHGGSTSSTGLGTVQVDGLVDTGLERHKVLTISYATSDTSPNSYSTAVCYVASEDCLAAPIDGQIPATITGPNPVGTDILNRLRQLQELLAQYGQDPVAKGAYQNEINFLEKKLVALGLGSFDGNGNFVPGTYAGPSPKQQALQLVQTEQSNIATVNVDLGKATGAAVSPDSGTSGLQVNGDYADGTFGLVANANTVLATVQTLGKYSAVKDSQSFKDTLSDLNTQLTSGAAAAAAAKTAIADNLAKQADVTAQTQALGQAQADLANALIAGDSAAASDANTRIANAKLAIQNDLGAISANNVTITGKSAAAKAAASAIQTDLGTLVAQAQDTSNSSDTTKIAALNAVDPNRNTGYIPNNGALTNVAVAVADLATQQTTLSGFVSSSGTTISTLLASTTGAGTIGGSNSLDQYVLLLGDLTNSLVTHTQIAATASDSSGTPMAYTIEVPDTLARLGNVSIYGDQLIGSGALSAPGDAKIEITNNTADTLELGSLVIPTYDSGHVRLNGVLVNSNDDINALNPLGTGAAFASVITGANSSRPLVSITSTYTADSLSSYNPSSPLHALNTQKIAPDIILKSGAVIDNETGAVNITSASGNIYINGKINAGSVNILARNGDFVSSYVDGFDNIGGDPASFNDPTRASEAGTGIIANGAVSISARYLNINSTIQSGIANWILNLDGAPTLTTASAGDIGLTDQQVSDAIGAYLADLTAAAGNPSSAPATTISLVNSKGQTITLNMGPAGLDPATLKADIADYLTKHATDPTATPIYTVAIGGVSQTINVKDFISGNITGRLEFTKAEADSYAAATGADGVYGVVSPSSNIGVSYDSRHGQYVVDGTSVHGGYIQLYGQIMNTAASGGHLNVLDGFGTISITNSGNIPVVLQTLSAGDDPTGTGRGTAGVIDITDVTGVDATDPTDPIVNARHTVYTRDYTPGDASGRVVIATQDGYIDNTSGLFTPKVAGSDPTITYGGDRNASYDPTRYQRYVWTTGAYFDNVTNFSVTKDQLFGSDTLTLSSSTHFDSVDGPHTLSTYRLADGTYVTIDQTQVGNTSVSQTNQGIILAPQVAYQSNASLDSTPLVSSTYSYINSSDGPNQTGSHRDCNWWTLCIDSDITYYYTLDQKFTTITTNSLKADNPITINFIGSDTGAITVKSPGDVILTNSVKDAAGAVTICAGGTDCSALTGTASIMEGNLAAQITARSVVLDAAGSVGGVTNTRDPAAPVKAAVNLALTGGGSLTANAGNGVVSIASRGDLVVDTVTAAGDATAGKGAVTLVAAGSITGAGSSSRIEAPRVTLSALTGAIGSTASGRQLLVDTGYIAGDPSRQFGDPATDPSLIQNPYYGLSATAGGDIGIRSVSWSGNADGTMLIDQVLSIGGDVLLSSPGQILDNNPVERIDSRTYAQLLDYWNSLDLLAGAGNTDKQAATIASYERAKTQAYDQYWRIRQTQANDGATYDAGFKVTVVPGTAQYAALSQQFGSEVRAANPSYTDQQVADAVTQKISDYAAAQTELYHQLNGEVGGYTTSFDPAYTYVASGTERADLTHGAVWTERELAFSLSPGALKTVTGTNPVVKDPNVAGRTVTIDAGIGIGETVGAGTAHPGISIAGDLDPSHLTDAQKVALATAERSDLQITVGKVSLPAGKTYADLTPEQQAEYDAAKSLSNVVVPLGTDFDKLTADQQKALNAAADGLVAGSDLTITVLSKRPLNFAASKALNVTVTDAPDSTLDKGDAYLASRGGAPLGTFSVPGETRVKVLGDIFNAAGGGAVSTGNIILEAAQGGIAVGLNPQTGKSYAPLSLDLAPGATLTARAQRGVDIALNGDAAIDTVYSPQDVTLSAASLSNANDDQLINVLGTRVALSATAGSIGSALHPLNVGVNIGGAITAEATGSVYLHGPAQNLFIIESALSGADIGLDATYEGIIQGQVSAPGQIALTAGGRFVITGKGDVESSAGAIAISADSLKMLNGAALSADTGRVYIATAGDALVTGVSSGSSDADAVSINAGGHVLAGTANGRTDISAMAAGAGVKIVAGLGIGDETQADDRYADGPGDAPGSANAIAGTANPMRIRTGRLDLAATAGDLDIEALSSVDAATLTADTGNIEVLADGNFGIDSASALYGALSITSSGSLRLDRAISGGTQSFLAHGNVVFTNLTTTGLPADPGDVDITAETGAISGGDIHASGSIRLDGNGITFGTIEAGLDSLLTSTGDIIGHAQIAGNTVNDIAGSTGAPGNIRIDIIRGKTLIFDATGDLTLPDLEVASDLVLRAGTLNVHVTQVPSGPDPLHLTLTGGRGTIGTLANVTVDSPAGLTIDQLRFIDANIGTSAQHVSVLSAYVPGSLWLTTPLQTLHFDDRTPLPQPGSNVQLYDPDFAFGLDLDGLHTTSDAFVVQYDASAQVTDILGGLPFDGASLVRDTIRIMDPAGTADLQTILADMARGEPHKVVVDLKGRVLVIDGVEYPIEISGIGPAVDLGRVH